MTRDVSKVREFTTADWVLKAEPGEEVIYWVGEHCAGPHRTDMYDMQEAGVVILFQRRAGNGRFAYHARRTRK